MTWSRSDMFKSIATFQDALLIIDIGSTTRIEAGGSFLKTKFSKVASFSKKTVLPICSMDFLPQTWSAESCESESMKSKLKYFRWISKIIFTHICFLSYIPCEFRFSLRITTSIIREYRCYLWFVVITQKRFESIFLCHLWGVIITKLSWIFNKFHCNSPILWQLSQRSSQIDETLIAMTPLA